MLSYLVFCQTTVGKSWIQKNEISRKLSFVVKLTFTGAVKNFEQSTPGRCIGQTFSHFVFCNFCGMFYSMLLTKTFLISECVF